MAAYWQANAATVQAWKTSWNPNHRGHGFGRRSRQAITPALYKQAAGAQEERPRPGWPRRPAGT